MRELEARGCIRETAAPVVEQPVYALVRELRALPAREVPVLNRERRHRSILSAIETVEVSQHDPAR